MKTFYEIEEGIGVYATEDIPANTTVIEFKGRIVDDFSSVMESELDQVLIVGDGRCLIDDGDSRYINHSDTPNCVFTHPTSVILKAIKDIPNGEELTFNYEGILIDL